MTPPYYHTTIIVEVNLENIKIEFLRKIEFINLEINLLVAVSIPSIINGRIRGKVVTHPFMGIISFYMWR